MCLLTFASHLVSYEQINKDIFFSVLFAYLLTLRHRIYLGAFISTPTNSLSGTLPSLSVTECDLDREYKQCFRPIYPTARSLKSNLSPVPLLPPFPVCPPPSSPLSPYLLPTPSNLSSKSDPHRPVCSAATGPSGSHAAAHPSGPRTAADPSSCRK